LPFALGLSGLEIAGQPPASTILAYCSAARAVAKGVSGWKTGVESWESAVSRSGGEAFFFLGFAAAFCPGCPNGV
jgi:hypothetical protein